LVALIVFGTVACCCCVAGYHYCKQQALVKALKMETQIASADEGPEGFPAVGALAPLGETTPTTRTPNGFCEFIDVNEDGIYQAPDAKEEGHFATTGTAMIPVGESTSGTSDAPLALLLNPSSPVTQTDEEIGLYGGEEVVSSPDDSLYESPQDGFRNSHTTGSSHSEPREVKRVPETTLTSVYPQAQERSRPGLSTEGDSATNGASSPPLEEW